MEKLLLTIITCFTYLYTFEKYFTGKQQVTCKRFATPAVKTQARMFWCSPVCANSWLLSGIVWDLTVNEQLALHSCSPGFCQSSGAVDERNPSSGDQLQCFLFIFSETASCSAAWTVAQALLLVLLSFQFLDLWLMNKACPLQKLQNQVSSKSRFLS